MIDDSRQHLHSRLEPKPRLHLSLAHKPNRVPHREILPMVLLPYPPCTHRPSFDAGLWRAVLECYVEGRGFAGVGGGGRCGEVYC